MVAPRSSSPLPLSSPAAAAVRSEPTPAERERVVEALCAQFAADALTADELEHRLERVYAASDRATLLALVADLPALPAELAADHFAPLLAPPGEVPARSAVMAVMGGVERKGSWIVPRQLKVIAILGGAELDLRQARFGPGVTEIEAIAFLGGVEVILPPGVRCESVGGAFAGGFDSKAGDVTYLHPGQPVVRLSGMAILGGVEAKTKRLDDDDSRGRRKRERERRRERDDDDDD